MPIIKRVMTLFSHSFFAKYLRVGEDGPGQGHLCHTDTFQSVFECLESKAENLKYWQGFTETTSSKKH